MEAPPLERKLAAILAADVEGYSRLMHANEEATLEMLTARRAIIDTLIAAGRGHIFGSAGDSVLAEFASVIDAVRCAVAMQQALHKADAGLAEERQMRFRIGINVGDIMVKDGGVFGDGVNVAARLEALAPPGGICVTRGVREHVRDRIEIDFEDMGEQAVKNIARPVRAFRVVFDPNGTTELVQDDLEASAPSASLLGSPTGAETATPAGVEASVELTFWTSAQASDNVEEYRAYLERYPDGAFAALARARLSGPEPDEAPTAEVRQIELAFWDAVKGSDNPAMFQAYVDKYPGGEFIALAEIRLGELQRQD